MKKEKKRSRDIINNFYLLQYHGCQLLDTVSLFGHVFLSVLGFNQFVLVRLQSGEQSLPR